MYRISLFRVYVEICIICHFCLLVFQKNVRKQVLPFYAEYSCTLYYYSTVDVLSCDIKLRIQYSEYFEMQWKISQSTIRN